MFEFAGYTDWELGSRFDKEVTSTRSLMFGLEQADIRPIHHKRNDSTYRRSPFIPQELKVKPLSTLGYMRLTMMAKPACVGMGDGSRAENMIRVAQKFGVSASAKLTGLDEFDGRDESQGKLSLIEMHRRLKAYEQAKTQLVPGDIKQAIVRIANSHLRTDLIVVSAGYDKQLLEETWFYFPRMLHSGSIVLVQRENGGSFESLNRLQIEKLTENSNTRQAIAA